MTSQLFEISEGPISIHVASPLLDNLFSTSHVKNIDIGSKNPNSYIFIFFSKCNHQKRTQKLDDTNLNQDIYVYRAVRMCLNYWWAYMKTGTETTIKQCISAIENVQPNPFSLIFDS